MEGITVTKLKPVHIDERGSITDLINKKVNHVGFIVTEKDTIRGSHYHKLSIQYNYIVSGKFEVTVANKDKPNETEKIILEEGDFITILPGIIHVFKALEKTVLIDIISESREGTGYEDDVVRVKLEQ